MAKGCMTISFRYNNRLTVCLVVTAVIVAGVSIRLLGHAAGSVVSSEPETGTVSSPAAARSDTAASGSKAVVFAAPGSVSNQPPPQSGYFQLQPAGNTASLPSGQQCSSQVHRSSWEPRPKNTKANQAMPNAAAVHASLSARRLGSSYDSRWDSWLIPRVDGQFSGTTDEIIQWGACKWGLPDNVIRAVANRESTWDQYLTYPSGRCVTHHSCGDFIPSASADSAVFCNALATYGYDYQKDYGAGICPETFSLMGIKSWQAPAWGQMADNQNGTFPFNRDSTAFAVDYYGAHIRGCYEGWILYLRSSGYAAGDLMGCVGNWFSGSWHDTGANDYAARVQGDLSAFPWLVPSWPQNQPACSAQYGCPVPSPY